MNVEEEQALAMALLTYTKSKRKLASLQEEARSIGVRLKSLAKLLKNSPQDISLDGPDGESIALLEPGRIVALIAEIRETLTETQRLEEKLKELGFDATLDLQRP